MSTDEARLYGLLVTYRRPQDLSDTLKLLAGQTRPVDHLILVDNSPGTGSENLLAAYTSRGLSAQYLPMSENMGPAGGIAAGMATALERADEADWFVPLDDDNPPRTPNMLAALATFGSRMATSDPALGGVGFMGARFDLDRGRAVRVDDGELHGAVPVDYVGGGMLPFYRASVVRTAGLVRSELFFGFDDLEYGLRLRRAGYNLYADGSPWLARRESFGRTGPAPAPRMGLDPPTWQRYYGLRNLVWILRDIGRSDTALRVIGTQGMAKPLIGVARRPGLAAHHLWINARASADGWFGRLGRRVEPNSFKPRGKLLLNSGLPSG